MNYNLINPNYKYDQLAAAIQSRQLEHFHYNFDKTNFEEMLLNLPEGDYKNQIQRRLEETISRMAEVQAIYDALVAQIDDQTKFDEAVSRLQNASND